MPNDSQIEATLAKLERAPIAELRRRWIERLRTDPPKAFGPDLLRRSLAQKIQEDAYGGLPAETRKLLNQLMAQSAKSNGRIVMPRRIKPGAILVPGMEGHNPPYLGAQGRFCI